MAGNGSGGPWGQGGGNRGSGNNGGGNNGGGNNGGRPPSGGGGQGPDLDDLVRKGQEQLRVLMGGKGGGNNKNGKQSGGGGGLGFGGIGLIALAALGLWTFSSFYRVDTSEQSVELLFGKFSSIGNEGLNFAPWPVVTKEILPVTRENTENIGVGRGGRSDQGLMLTGDENIVDIDFQVVWNINNPQEFLFNLAEPQATIRAVSESVMREIVARTDLTPILTTGKGEIAAELQTLIQETLDSYDAGCEHHSRQL